MEPKEYEFLSAPYLKNFVFIGEAGCGKSELALSLALRLKKETGKEVCLFDLDMTKPLFRSRDLADFCQERGVDLKYVEQFEDAPTTGGWVDNKMNDPNVYCVLDVGGDHMGARAIGVYRRLLNSPMTEVYYVVNPYRPWSDTIEHIDAVLSQILTVSGIGIGKLKMRANPYMGDATTKEDIEEGYGRVLGTISSYKAIEAVMVPEDLVEQVEVDAPVVTIRKKIIYPW